MLANSYLIIGPSEPTDTDAAVMCQRQTIPLGWALAVSAPTSRLISTHGHHYFETRIDDSLKVLDRALAAWNYNSYFRDTLAPIGVFRSAIANYPSESWLYLNITELIARSPSPDRDLTELRLLPEHVAVAIGEIEKKEYTLFLAELRRLSYPFVTVPITGDRERDLQILAVEKRDTESIEAEMALQMVGIDRDRTMFTQATDSIRLRRDRAAMAEAQGEAITGGPLEIIAPDFDAVCEFFREELGYGIVLQENDTVVFETHGVELRVRRS